MEYKPTNCVVIPCKKTFYKSWLEFLQPIHGLANKEMDIAAYMLEMRKDIADSCPNKNIIDEILFSTENRKNVMKKFGMKLTYFNTVLNKFRKCGFVESNKINPKLIPKFGEGQKNCQLLLVFNDK